MEIIIICLAAFLTSVLTFFSGFGLGTILLPVFTFFFPVELAIALTGVVHFTNNLFKITLVGRLSDKSVLLRFGIPAVIASFAGAWLLTALSALQPLVTYNIGGNQFEVTPVKLVIAVLLAVFSVREIIPVSGTGQTGKRNLFAGGLLSGFFGGLTGIQGAIRSAFLISSGLKKEAYIATGVVIAVMVDITRLSVYAGRLKISGLHDHLPLIISSVLSAMAGASLGRMLLKKVTFKSIRMLVAVMLILVSFALGAGLI